MKPPIDRLACPSCHGDLSWGDEVITCGECRATFPIVDGIPVLTFGDRSIHKAQQAAFFDGEDPDYEINRPHGTPRFYQWLFAEKCRRSTQAIPGTLSGRTVLTVCGGSGMDAEYLAKAGACVIASDLSLGAAQRTRERARRFGFQVMPIVADAERLPFRDRSVDLVYVHDGLHHLEHPMQGIGEMARVAAGAVSISEPARAVATEVAVRLGISQRVEDAGNRVERLAPGEISLRLAECGFDVVHAERYAMYYRHRAGRVFAAMSLPGLFSLSKLTWKAGNIVLGRVGNKLTVQAVRRKEGSSDLDD